MRMLRLTRILIVALAFVGLLFPCPHVWASEGDAREIRSRSVVADVSLSPAGQLSGVVRAGSGSLTVGCPVTLTSRASGQHMATVTDDAGRFAVEGLSGGLYQIDTPHGSTVCRCWAAGTAPPSASEQLLIVDDQLIQRGQKPLAEAIFSTQTLLVLMIAAAIVIPIAVHNSQKDAS